MAFNFCGTYLQENLEHKYKASCRPAWRELRVHPYPSRLQGTRETRKPVERYLSFRSDPPLDTSAVMLCLHTFILGGCSEPRKLCSKIVLISSRACVKCGSCPAFCMYALVLSAWNLACKGDLACLHGWKAVGFTSKHDVALAHRLFVIDVYNTQRLVACCVSSPSALSL